MSRQPLPDTLRASSASFAIVATSWQPCALIEILIYPPPSWHSLALSELAHVTLPRSYRLEWRQQSLS